MTAPAVTAPSSGRDVRVHLGRVYNRLAVGVAALTAGVWTLTVTGVAGPLTARLLSGSWLLVLGGFMAATWAAGRIAASAEPARQWAGYTLLVAANTVLFTPLVTVAEAVAPGTVRTAAVAVAVMVAALSVIARRSSRDYRWLGATLRWAGLVAVGTIVVAVVTGLTLGTWFSVAMIGVAGAAILHDTQHIVEHGRPGTETLDAMALFSSVTLMLWYVIRLLTDRR